MAAKRKSKRAAADASPVAVDPDALLKQVTKGVKMVKNPVGYQEPDTSAGVLSDAERGAFDGPNPYIAGTSRYLAYDRLKKSHKGA